MTKTQKILFFAALFTMIATTFVAFMAIEDSMQALAAAAQ